MALQAMRGAAVPRGGRREPRAQAVRLLQTEGLARPPEEAAAGAHPTVRCEYMLW